MSPISQSQFIPLGEVLLLAISAMNSAHKPVTQEALTDHLQTCFPGVPTPTEEVLHHTLSMLVRERKIYPTPDGYFIVTPQTYFITPSLIRTSSKWYHLDERSAERHSATQHQQTQCTSPLSGTVTPSTSGGAVVVGGRGVERTHPKPSQNHSGGGDSSYNNSYRDDPPSHHTTLQRRSPKDHREAPYPSPHPSPQTPPTQAGGAVATTTEKTRSTLSFPFKTDTLTKHRGGGGSTETEHKTGGSGSASRKFGLKLFRLSFKKDKTKQLATFSAQFPPVEWPLRDEEAPSALPRTVEMEIIRRINPDLTVENLARHTAVMKRLEEERAQRSKASSANQSSRSRRSGGGGGRHRKPSQTKAARSHSKARSSGRGGGGGTGGEPGDELATTPGDRDYRAYSSSLARSPREHAVAAERQRARMHLAHSNPNILDASAHLPQTPEWDVSGELAKRRTEMPFPEPSHGPSAHHPKVHRSHSHTQERKSRGERSGDKAKERSRSMDNSKGPLGGGVGLAGPPDYYEDRGGGRYYTDDGTLRAAAAAAANQGSSSHYSRLAATPPTSSSSNKLAAGGGDSSHHGGGGGGRSLERKCKSRDSVLPAYSPKPPHRGVAASSAAPGASSASSSALPLPLLADDTDYFPGERGGEMPLPLSSLLSADTGNHAGVAAPPGTLGRKGGGGAGHDERQTDRQTDRQTPRPPAVDYKDEGGKGGGSLPPMPLDPHPPALLSNGRLPHASQGGGGSAQEKQQQQRKEIFSKDTLFKPPPSMPCSLPPSMPCSLPGYSSLRKPCSGSGGGGGLAPPPSASALSSSSCDAMLLLDPAPFQDSAPKPLVASVLMPPPQQPPPRDDAATGSSSGGAAEASSSFDYYNVSDDEELDEGTKRGADGKTGGGMGGGLGPGSGGGVGMGGMMGGVGAGGTMQWLLEREKERDLQRRFERNLTFPSSSSKASASKENSLPDHHHHHHAGHHHSQQGAHSARLDSMDSSSVTVDSGFNSPRTRESLASNTSSIVESNRRQNLALSPGHLGGGAPGTGPPPFSFRAVPEPPLPAAPNPDKLQKAGACLASITSV